MGESVLGTMCKHGNSSSIKPLTMSDVTVHLFSCFSETLNNIRLDAFGYNKCLFGSSLEAALMSKTFDGEKQHDC
jgi:hypothetical protein